MRLFKAAALAALVLAVMWGMPAEARPHARVHHHRGAVVRVHLRGHHHHRVRAARPVFASLRGNGDAVAIAMRYLGSGNPTGTRGPWCGDFMNLLEHRAGRPGIASRMATAWARYGRPSGPVPGAIAVFRSHVARVIGRAGDRLQIISGNWSRRVGIGWVSVRSAIAFRMP